MYREQLDDIIVVWANTGAEYPEVEADMRRISKDIPHFLIVKGKQPENIAKNGFPSDVVPLRYSPLGRQTVKSAEPFKIQSAFECCASNLWRPLEGAMKLLGIKTIIRGQRKDEEYSNAFVSDGTVIDGIEYKMPLENWTREQVLDYLAANKVKLPDYYQSETASRGCWDCTAYLSDYVQRIRNLPADKRAVVDDRLAQIKEAVRQEMAPIDALLTP